VNSESSVVTNIKSQASFQKPRFSVNSEPSAVQKNSKAPSAH